MALLDFLGKRVFGNAGLEHKLTDLADSGKAGYDRGTAVADEGLGLIRSSIAGYQSKLDSGEALDPSVQRAYKLAFGRTADTAARSVNASSARLEQARRAGGGFLSPEQEAELQHQAERDAQDQQYAAETGLEISRAHDEMSAVHDLMDRMDTFKGTILNYGQFQEQLGQQARIAGILAQLDRRKAQASTLVSGFAAGSGYGSKSGGGDN